MNNFKSATRRMGAAAGLLVCLASFNCLARSFDSDDNSAAGVIPSPNQEFGDSEELAALSRDLQRTQSIVGSARSFPMASAEPQQLASNEASVPVYVSPFERSERSVGLESAYVRPQAQFDASQESSHAPPNYAPRPVPSASSATAADLKTSASYGHNHHGHYGHDHSGWLDMGAWTGGKGSFGWYADYPVGGKHHGHYGRK